MQPFARFNNGNKYILMIIDVFGKYGFAIPLTLFYPSFFGRFKPKGGGEETTKAEKHPIFMRFSHKSIKYMAVGHFMQAEYEIMREYQDMSEKR